MISDTVIFPACRRSHRPGTSPMGLAVTSWNPFSVQENEKEALEARLSM
ncbi:hypothetical protein MXAN_2196 [Myxococcus xanthus DK 1622]|uniref:Uncharacterized protein n=1 Tax=Myxococcus xanthus (strain DK1622) TaxID=246197 RepID=Q1DAA4_MYXXD|nr:hypothetical protein MXAN_2196 [Myxococcus xanthus DK 1622]